MENIKISEHRIIKREERADNGLMVEVARNNIYNRRGVLIVSRQLLMESDINTLKVIFSNFIPIDADRYHSINYWDSIKY